MNAHSEGDVIGPCFRTTCVLDRNAGRNGGGDGGQVTSANRSGGGGGGAFAGNEQTPGLGGSGIVIVRYAV